MLFLKKIILICLFYIFYFDFTHAQYISNEKDTPIVSFKNKPKFFLNIDRSSSFISGKGAITTELRIGLDFKKKIRLGIGIAELSSDVVAPKLITTESNKDSSLNAKLTLTYLTFNGEYTLYESKRWQITTPFTTGIGSSYFSYYEKVGSSYKTKRLEEGRVVLVTPAVVATYRILRWFGVSAGFGYRQLLVNNTQSKQKLNSPVYILRLKIYMGEIYKTIFPKGITGKHDPPYSNEYWD